MKHIKLYEELYRTNRSNIFKKEYVRKISDAEYDQIYDKRKIDFSFNIESIKKIFNDLNIRYIPIQTSYITIRFENEVEDLSWGGMLKDSTCPPILYLGYSLTYIIFEDEYTVIQYFITKDDGNGSISYFKSGKIWIDGLDNIAKVTKDMIENYDQL